MAEHGGGIGHGRGEGVVRGRLDTLPAPLVEAGEPFRVKGPGGH